MNDNLSLTLSLCAALFCFALSCCAGAWGFGIVSRALLGASSVDGEVYQKAGFFKIFPLSSCVLGAALALLTADKTNVLAQTPAALTAQQGVIIVLCNVTAGLLFSLLAVWGARFSAQMIIKFAADEINLKRASLAAVSYCAASMLAFIAAAAIIVVGVG